MSRLLELYWRTCPRKVYRNSATVLQKRPIFLKHCFANVLKKKRPTKFLNGAISYTTCVLQQTFLVYSSKCPRDALKKPQQFQVSTILGTFHCFRIFCQTNIHRVQKQAIQLFRMPLIRKLRLG